MGSQRVSPSKLDSLIDSVREPVFWTGADRKLLGVNRAWESLTGLSLDSVVGLHCRSVNAELVNDAPSVVSAFHVPMEALQGNSVSTDSLIRLADGESCWKRIDFTPLNDPNGEIAAIIGFVREAAVGAGFPFAETERLRVELLKIRTAASSRSKADLFVGKGDAHGRILEQIAIAAKSDLTFGVLIHGEAGTGKRLVARTIYHHAKSDSASLFTIDCEALPAEILERTLFGSDSIGREVEEQQRLNFPERSTLILENGLSLPRDLQKRILSAEKSRVRWIVTTSSDPEAALVEDRIRSDFYHAITAVVIRLAPLRDRLEELPLLAQALLERANARSTHPRSGFSVDAIETLRTYDWPGNLHELARVISSAMVRAKGEIIERADLPAAIQGDFASAYLPKAPSAPLAETTLDELLEEVERKLIEKALKRCEGNKSKASEQLGISRPRLHRRIKELNIVDEAEST